jgi:PglZ domain
VSFGERVLDWLLRRLSRQRPIDSDLVLVRADEAIADTPASCSFDGQTWLFASVSGELSLRNELYRGQRLVAAIPDSLRLPPDLSDRAYLRRPVTVEAHDIVAALSGNFCARIQSAPLADAISKRPRWLYERQSAWTLGGGVVSEAEVKKTLAALELGFDRKLERLSTAELLKRWILEGPPDSTVPDFAREVLRETHRNAKDWLPWVLSERQLDTLLAAGALGGTERGRSVAPAVPGVEREDDWRELVAIVEEAVRLAHADSPSIVSLRLAKAECLAPRARIRPEDVPRHPLLRSALEAALFELAEAAAEGKPATEATVAALSKNIHASAPAGPPASSVAQVREISRLARFCAAMAVEAPGPDAKVAAWAQLARDHIGWADWTARVVRRLGDAAPNDLARPRQRVLERYVTLRDQLNRRFAHRIAENEVGAYRHVNLPDPLPLHLVSREVLAPLVKAGQKVLLVVLDGCDLGTFYEMLEAHRSDPPIVLRAPKPLDVALKGVAVLTALSPLPTVTSHGRRALFAGEIPRNPALDDTESAAANARHDQAAFASNTALRGVPKRLFLKGELGDGGVAVEQAIRAGTEQLIAVVFNAVDDALASHETTAMGLWSFGALGAALVSTLTVAAHQKWVVVLTSDHGHTPFWSNDRKAAGTGSARFADKPLPGSVELVPGGLRTSSLHVLTDIGAFAGPQRRGFHGGAGLEEVVVPLAFFAAAGMEAAPLPRPSWWTGEDDAPDAVVVEAMVSPIAITVSPGNIVPDDVRAALAGQPEKLRVVQLIAEKTTLTSKVLGSLIGKRATFAVVGLVGEIQRILQRSRTHVPFTVEGEGEEQIYRWKPQG